MLLPAACPGCARPGPVPCRDCLGRLEPPPDQAPPAGVDEWYALFRYDGVGRDLVVRLKYRNARAGVRWLALHLADQVDPGEFDVVTWAPTTAARRRARGYDQAELLARAVARRLGRPCRRLLRRASGPHQTGRSRAERQRDLRMRPVGRVPRSVLVIDDVATTGATLAASAQALRLGGAQRITALTAARTPPRAGALPSVVDAATPEAQWT